MYDRHLHARVRERLKQFPAVALLGPRQVGKTTLARTLAAGVPSVHLDLERPSDLAKLSDPELFLGQQSGRLVVLDEVHRVPEIFRVLRGAIDERRAAGERAEQFLLLGSASIELLHQTSESLAGRIAFVELAPLCTLEVGVERTADLWLRGGFPDALDADHDEASDVWRRNFIRTYLERDVPALGPRIPAETLRRFWTMLAHDQGGQLNVSALARSLGVSGRTVSRYLDLMVDLLLVRRLAPLHANLGKRLVKSPKVYVRDSGLAHGLLGIPTREALLGHPVAGGSWEGFVIEQLLAAAPEDTAAHFYRTAAGAEMDLVLDLPQRGRWAIEIKLGMVPRVTRGFHEARADVNADRAFVVYSGEDRYELRPGVEAIGVAEMAELVADRVAPAG